MVIPFSQSFSRKLLYGNASVDLRGRSENAILEFLYPPQTLALFKKLSAYPLDQLAHRATRLGSRLFSSTSIRNVKIKYSLQTMDSGDIGSAVESVAEERPLSYPEEIFNLYWVQEADGIKPENKEISARERFMLQLQNPIRSPQDGTRFDKAWESFHKLSKSDQDFELAAKLMSFLSFSSQEDDRVRLLLLFKAYTIPESHIFWKEILLNIQNQRFDRALEFYDIAVSKGSGTELGSDLILAHAIWNRNWKVARDIFDRTINFQHTNDKQNNLHSLLSELWKMTSLLPDLVSLTSHFIQQSPYKDSGKDDAFAYHLSCFALAHCTVPESLNILLPLLRYYKLESIEMYESSIWYILNLAKNNTNSMNGWRRVTLQKLWSSYRIYCKPGEITKPLIHDLLSILTERSVPSLTWEAEDRRFITDILSVCADDKVPLPYEFMVRLMEIYASHGNLDAVRLLEENLYPKIRDLRIMKRSKEEGTADIYRMAALLRVYSERRDIAGVHAEFESIVQQFPRAKGFRRLWHQIINVYSRSGMVKEAFKVALVDMPAAGALPSRRTMLHLLWLCGWSGDTSAVLAVLSIAEKNKIPLDEWMVRRLIQAYIKSHPGAVAEEMDELMESHQINKETWSTSAMTVLFNELLVIIASRRDLRSANRIYLRMVEEQLPISAQTFWALIKLLCNLMETDDAAKLVKEVMPAHGMAPSSTFYAQLMRGYAIEKQWEKVLAVHEEMDHKGMRPNTLSQTKYIEAVAMLNRSNPEKDLEILAILNRFLTDKSIEVYWSREDPPIWYRHHTDAYFYHLMDAYCDIGANEMVQAIQQMYWDFQKMESLSGDPPLGIMKSFMKAAAFSNNHEVVADFWHKSVKVLKDYVKSMASTFKQASNMASAGTMVSFNDQIRRNKAGSQYQGVTSNSQTFGDASFGQNTNSNPSSIHPSDPEHIADSQISVAHLLSRHIGWYMSSLSNSGNFKGIINAVRDLQSSGFKLTSQAWNVYIMTLCRSSDPNDLIAAFRATEVHLMPNSVAHFTLTTRGDKDLHRAMVKRQRRAQAANYQLYLNTTTLKNLRDVHESSASATVEGSSVGLERDANISLTGVLESVAPTLTNVLKSWERPLVSRQTLTFHHWNVAGADARKRMRNKRSSQSAVQNGMGLDTAASLTNLDTTNFLINSQNEELLSFDAFQSDSDPNADLDAALLSLQGRERRKEKTNAWRWPDEPLDEGAAKLLSNLASQSSMKKGTSASEGDSTTTTAMAAVAEGNGGVKSTLNLAGLLSRAYTDAENGQPMRPSEVVALLRRGLPKTKEEKENMTFQRLKEVGKAQSSNSLGTIGDLIGTPGGGPSAATNSGMAALEKTFERVKDGSQAESSNQFATISDFIRTPTAVPPTSTRTSMASNRSDVDISEQLLEAERGTKA
jgi:pentatricopeptide repeat protein